MTERNTHNEHDNSYNPSHLSALPYRDQQLVGVAMSHLPPNHSKPKSTFDHYVDLMHENEQLERDLDAAVATVLEAKAIIGAYRSLAAYLLHNVAALQQQVSTLQRKVAASGG